ncbi:Peptide methionine sulfoxide reductase [Araneus ventricosus]|uniref:peptide-methionine (S)-S-oxide reductase n=1 Tax=Araneus ventricosus TaxID=182803 RepID=A0A4Y2K5F0_ARAVE|nr:Peptide methionine sulfoxide reductase [Araneus ventricosus]
MYTLQKILTTNARSLFSIFFPTYHAASTLHSSNMKTATFAMGCFWHPDALFGCQKGVQRTRVGYTGGTLHNPTYRNLGDHTEAIDIDFDPEVISYEDLLELFWKNHDPTVPHKRQYRTAIFYRDEEQKALASESKKKKEKVFKNQILTAIEPFNKFYNAEDYHQKYYLQTHHTKLFNSLGIKPKDLVDSTIAAKLNGYVVGENTMEAFHFDCELLGLSPEYTAYVEKMIAKGKQAHC